LATSIKNNKNDKKVGEKEEKRISQMYIADSKTVTSYKADPSSLQGGRPTTDKTTTVLIEANIWS
jgi:hypothetical protein